MARRLRREDYTVGWVCALPDKLTAAQEMLDEEHQDLPTNGNDTNIYTLGCIGEHDVVLVCLPARLVGIGLATAVAIQIKASFPVIRFGLIVGIGGGVLDKQADIRLRNVIVSQLGRGYRGVI
jgi:nucleoside phosphorylase